MRSLEDTILGNQDAVASLLIPLEILHTLENNGNLSQSDVQNIEAKALEKGDIAASYLLMQLLERNNCTPGWGRSFVDALTASADENSLLIMILNGDCDYNILQTLKKLFSLFRSKLEKNLADVNDFISNVRDSGVLSDSDCERITAQLTEHGQTAALRTAFNYVHRRTSCWFDSLLLALWRIGRHDLLYEIIGIQEDDAELDKWKSLENDEGKIKEKISKWIEELKTQIVKVETNNAVIISPEGHCEVMTSSDQSALANCKSATTKPTAPVKPQTDFSESGSSSDVTLIAPELTDSILDGPNTDDGLSVASAGGDTVPDPDEDLTAELELRNYQLEVAQPALEGKNSIVIMPTGTGKTHVALWVTKNHLERCPGAKAVFVVPVKTLVHQQTQTFKKYLPQYKCKGIIGSGTAETSQRIPFEILCQSYDILVLTPQILINAVDRDKVMSINVFTLIILDECHHSATGNHPHRALCRLYLKENLHTNPGTVRPLVLGLTASVGVGKSTTERNIHEHILKLCGALCTEVIQPVIENIEELNEFRNTPFEEIYTVPLSKDDKFFQVTRKIMEKIENSLKNLASKTIVNDSAATDQLQAVPPQWDHQSYTQWVHSLAKALNTVTDKQIRRWLFACIDELKLYNEALFLNAYCRSEDALQFIQGSKKASSGTIKQKDQMDLNLEKIFSDHLDELKHVISQKQLNNSLWRLKNILLEYRQKVVAEGEELRGIIFVKTRAMTLALQQWMEDDVELEGLKPHYFTSTNTSTDNNGLKASEQVQVLKDFKTGVHKIIIATTVAEEGLDIQECNLVIRYHHVTNVTSRIQSKGRGRKKNAHYICIGDQNTVDQDQLNSEKEKLMHKAVTYILAQPRGWFQNHVLPWSKEILSEVANKRAVPKREATGIIRFKCNKCSTEVFELRDIRLLRGTHHAIVKPGFEKLYVKIPSEQRYFDKMTVTHDVYCNLCPNYKTSKWGVVQRYQGCDFIVVSVFNFLVTTTGNGSRDEPLGPYKTWAKFPYVIKELSEDDIKLLEEQAASVSNEEEVE